MAFYLIGTGMDKRSLSVEALEILQKCDKVYLENYTVNFPYKIEELSKEYGIQIKELDRKNVEDEFVLKQAKEKEIALLVYGDALSATTHMQLILTCKKQNIPHQIFHNASIITVIAATGLQPYKFGKTASMPNWEEHTNKPTSFTNYIKENQSIGAHTLLLTDIGLEIKDSINQLEKSIKIQKKIIVISNAGTPNQKIFYDNLKNIKEKDIPMPFCLIVTGNLNHIEEEALEELKEN